MTIFDGIVRKPIDEYASSSRVAVVKTLEISLDVLVRIGLKEYVRSSVASATIHCIKPRRDAIVSDGDFGAAHKVLALQLLVEHAEQPLRFLCISVNTILDSNRGVVVKVTKAHSEVWSSACGNHKEG